MTRPPGRRSCAGAAMYSAARVFACCLAASSLLASEPPAPTEVASLVSKPVPVARGDMPAVFRKGAPSSIEDLKVIEKQVKAVVARVSPAVVAVRVGNGAGSAVVISEDGVVLCAAHVCEGPGRSVEFTFPDGRTARGKTLGMNHEMDAGLIKIIDPGPWPHVELASPQDVHSGDWVLALGYPGGSEPERSLVARLGRVLRRSSLLQTDCTLLAGDSGGPLFDVQGRVVGIHSRISDSISGNFHVAVGSFLEVWDRLAKGENWGEQTPPVRSSVGVRGVDDPEGCRLEFVYEDGPGYRAGLRAGDIVLHVNGERIEDAGAFAQCVRAVKPGAEVTFEIKREGAPMSLRVKVEARRGRGGGRWRPNP